MTFWPHAISCKLFLSGIASECAGDVSPLFLAFAVVAAEGRWVSLPGMQIFIKSLNGKTITLDVEPSSTINFTKAEITRRVGLNPGEQRLVLNGHQLVVDGLCTLLEVGITPNTTLILAPENGVVVVEVSTGRFGRVFSSNDGEEYLILWESDWHDGIHLPDEEQDWRRADELRFDESALITETLILLTS